MFNLLLRLAIFGTVAGLLMHLVANLSVARLNEIQSYSTLLGS